VRELYVARVSLFRALALRCRGREMPLLTPLSGKNQDVKLSDGELRAENTEFNIESALGRSCS
jgi:hypothetical protein